MSTQSTAYSSLPQDAPPELAAAIADAISDIFDRHGAAAFAAPREAAVAHEVGHAIVGTHEGFQIRELRVYQQKMPNGGRSIWTGRCEEAAGTWTTGPDTTADEDLRRARFIVGGLAGEAVMRMDKPGSSIDELALSQFVGVNVAAKLADPRLTDEEYNAYVQRLWHEKVWDEVIAILRENRKAFAQLVNRLDQQQRVEGVKLRKILSKISRRGTT